MLLAKGFPMALTAEQVQELRSIVERRRTALAREVGQDLDRVREDGLDKVVGAVPDPGDESVQKLIQDLDQAEATRGLSELRTLDAARARMDDRSCGICTHCAPDLGSRRPRPSPGAGRCIRCQTRCEKTHGCLLRTSL